MWRGIAAVVFTLWGLVSLIVSTAWWPPGLLIPVSGGVALFIGPYLMFDIIGSGIKTNALIVQTFIAGVYTIAGLLVLLAKNILHSTRAHIGTDAQIAAVFIAMTIVPSGTWMYRTSQEYMSRHT